MCQCLRCVKNAKRKFQWSIYNFKHGAKVEVESAFSVGSGLVTVFGAHSEGKISVTRSAGRVIAVVEA